VSRHVDGVRLALYQQLLARADERALRGKRGHHLTQPGQRDRFARIWFRSLHVWAEHERSRRAGGSDTWMLAKPANVLPRLLRIGR
jgi:hypothetical protein